MFRKKRVRTPTIIQMEAVECGAASLGIVLAYYKKFLPLETLRDICGVSRDGSNALQIIKGANKLGMSAEAYKYDVKDLKKIKLPFIVFWNFNHFLVVEGFSKKYVYLNDPGMGPRKVTHSEFSDSFTGISVALEPDKDFKRGGSKPSLLDALKKRLNNTLKSFSFLMLATLALVVPGLGVPIFTQMFFDKVIPHETSSMLFYFGLIVTMFLYGMLTWLQMTVLTFLNIKLSIRLSSKFFGHILRLPINFFSQRYPAEIANRAIVNDRVIQVLTSQLVLACVNLFFVFFYLFVMVQINWIITLVTVCSAAINMLTLKFINRARRDAYARLQQDLGKSIGISAGAIRNIETLKASGSENDFFSRWAGYYTKASDAFQEINKKDIYLTSVPPFLMMLTTAFFLTIGAKQVMTGHLSIGALLALQVLIGNFLSPFSQFINLGQVIGQVRVDLNRIDDVLENPVDKYYTAFKDIKDDKQTRLLGKIDLKNISFGYNKNAPPIISDLNIDIDPGKSVAFVGKTGSGKTTISKMIAGLFEPWSGDILFDMKDRFDLPRDLVIRSLSTVDQNIFIFEGSVKENISFWDTTIFEEDIIRAAKDAMIHDEIIRMEDGYNSKILEVGKNLSGGQKQRIEIARALVRNPSIIILDEATAALDSETEYKIIRNITRRGCSIIMVAHRLSTIKNCDEIIVLGKGKVVERGTHDELKDIKGVYYELVAAQGIGDE